MWVKALPPEEGGILVMLLLYATHAVKADTATNNLTQVQTACSVNETTPSKRLSPSGYNAVDLLVAYVLMGMFGGVEWANETTLTSSTVGRPTCLSGCDVSAKSPYRHYRLETTALFHH